MQNFVFLSAVIIFSIGLLIIIKSDNYFHKLVGLIIFQNSVLVFYIALSKLVKSIPPINQYFNTSEKCELIYTSPVPHVLMLTAIVVGFATLSVGLSLIYRIKSEFGSISEKEVLNELNE